MMVDEISRRLNALRQASQEFSQYCNLIEGNFDTKISEIKSLEMRRDKLREECDETQKKANDILQAASEEAATMRKEAHRLLEEAQAAKLQSKTDQEEGAKAVAEGKALLAAAQQHQREADVQWRLIEDKKKRLLEAASS